MRYGSGFVLALLLQACITIDVGDDDPACDPAVDPTCDDTCVPACGARECGVDPVCGEPCGECSLGTCDEAAGACVDATACGGDCAANVYSACTCGADDPCAWQADGYCDQSECDALLPLGAFDDTLDCEVVVVDPCGGQCEAGEYTFCTCSSDDPCGWQQDGTCNEPSCAAVLPFGAFDDSEDCGGSEACGDECALGTYSACTCGASDPCGWAYDGVCDSDCAALAPDDHFTEIVDCIVDPSFTLMVSTSGDGEGSVLSHPAGIACGSACTADLPRGSEVTLSATPGLDSVFSGWEGACTGSGPCVITLGRGISSVTAVFTRTTPEAACDGQCGYDIQNACTCGASDPCGRRNNGMCESYCPGGAPAYDDAADCGATSWKKLAVNILPTRDSLGGAVRTADGMVNCSWEDCEYYFAEGTAVALTATPQSGSSFLGWAGACSGTGTCTVTMSALRYVEARFGEVAPSCAGAWRKIPPFALEGGVQPYVAATGSRGEAVYLLYVRPSDTTYYDMAVYTPSEGWRTWLSPTKLPSYPYQRLDVLADGSAVVWVPISYSNSEQSRATYSLATHDFTFTTVYAIGTPVARTESLHLRYGELYWNSNGDRECYTRATTSALPLVGSGPVPEMAGSPLADRAGVQGAAAGDKVFFFGGHRAPYKLHCEWGYTTTDLFDGAYFDTVGEAWSVAVTAPELGRLFTLGDEVVLLNRAGDTAYRLAPGATAFRTVDLSAQPNMVSRAWYDSVAWASSGLGVVATLDSHHVDGDWYQPATDTVASICPAPASLLVRDYAYLEPTQKGFVLFGGECTVMSGCPEGRFLDGAYLDLVP